MDIHEHVFKQKRGKRKGLENHDKAWQRYLEHHSTKVKDVSQLTPMHVAAYLDALRKEQVKYSIFKAARATLCSMIDTLRGTESAKDARVKKASKAYRMNAPSLQKKQKPLLYFDLNKGFEEAEKQMAQGRTVWTVRIALLFSMAVDLLGRGDDLACVALDLLEIKQDSVDVVLVNTKEMSGPGKCKVTIQCYKPNPNWCTVCLLKEYLDFTKQFSVEPTLVHTSQTKYRPLFAALRNTASEEPLKELSPTTINSLIYANLHHCATSDTAVTART